MSYRASRTVLAALLVPLGAAGAQWSPPNPNRPITARPLQFELLGPADGGRIASIAGVPGDTTTWYIGSASGGVWKSTDGGHRFVPVFDSMPVQAIGALAVAPSNPKIVWAGTGEAWAIRDADIMGDGIYKSEDAGRTWKHMGLRETGRIGRIIVHPTNPNIVYVCALGRATGPQEERGVYRTTDGGATWKRVLFVDQNTGCSSLAMDAKNPNVLFAGMWQVVMHTWAMFSGGPSSGIWTTRDGGTTWTKVEHPGLPKPPLGKIGVAIAPTNSNRVYALIQTANQGSLWRSDDGGKSWKVVSWARPLIGRAGYYMHLVVSSGNPDEVLVANSSFWRSTDGGRTFRTERWGGDTHDIWMDPKNPDHFGITDDGGARVTTTHGKSFTTIRIPNAQMYHVAVDERIPYWVYGNRQDDGTMRGPSDAPDAGLAGFGGGRGGGGGGGGRATPAGRDTARGRAAAVGRAGTDTTRGTRRTGAPADTSEGEGATFYGAPARGREWQHGLGGCESGFTLPDVNDPDIVWASCYGNKVSRYDDRTGTARDVSPWMISLDSPPNDTRYRCHWTPPLAIDPFDTKTVYYGCQVIFKTSDGGQSWSVISPDLSTQDPSKIVSSGGIVGDNLGQFYGEVVFAIAPSEIRRGLIWAGTNDGQVWVTQDGGGSWTNVTKNIPGLPEWGTVRKIEPSHFDPGTAYLAVDLHLMDDRKPYVYKTTDYGKTWTNITSDLPTGHPLDYVMAITENRHRKGMLFVGTGHGFYYSLDDGGHWTQFKDGLPAAPVSWIVVPKIFHDVVVSTYGRGIYVLRDVTALEHSGGPAEEVALYAPQPGYRQARSGRADLTFRVPKAGRVELEVLDSAAHQVRRMAINARTGLNRVTWDLRYDLAPQVELRTLAPDNPHIWDEPRFRKPTRPVLHWGIEGPLSQGPLAAPGRYTVRLTVNGTRYTQSLEILKDPKISSPVADLVASTAMQVRIRDDMAAAVEMINRIEVMRKQLEDERAANAANPDLVREIDAMDKKMLDVELRLLSRSDLESDDKWYVEAYKVYLNLVWLAGAVGTGAGDVAGGADYRPTDTQVQVLELIERDLDAAKAAYKTLMETDVPAFNARMSGRLKALAADS
jgi:photosystem II stability/assembly factor-like uncharacterized protein